MKYIAGFILLMMTSLIIPGNIFAQQYEDIIYLKNGTVYFGIIVEEVPGEYIKLKTKDGKVHEFKIADIEKRKKEEIILKKEEIKINEKGVQEQKQKKQYFAQNSMTIQPIGLFTALTNIEYDRNLSSNFSTGVKFSFMTFFGRGFIEFEGEKNDVENAEAMKKSLSAWGVGSHLRYYPGNKAVQGFFFGLAFENLFFNYDEVDGDIVKEVKNRDVGLFRLEFEIGNRIKLSSQKAGFTIQWTLGAGIGFVSGIGKNGDESSTIPLGSIGLGLGYSF